MAYDAVSIWEGESSPSAYAPAGSKNSFLPREAARTPVRPRERIIGQFRSPQNIAYLRRFLEQALPAGALRKFATDTLEDAIYSFDRATEVLGSDPTAVRGGNRPAMGFWNEVKRLNRVFVADRMAFLREQANLIEKTDQKTPGQPRDFAADENEPYAMRMFISDSLRPPGYERLNTPGPLFGIREDQANDERIFRGAGQASRASPLVKKAPPKQPAAKSAAAAAAPSKQSFTSAKSAPAKAAKPAAAPVARWADPIGLRDEAAPAQASDDDAWDALGNPNRDPEQAMAEYWGEGAVPTGRTLQGEEEQAGTAYGSLYSWGNNWEKNGGTRLMRRPAIPFWQKLSREGADYDIEETLGTAGREFDSHVRRWDMDRVRKPGGEDYRRYGQRSGYIT